MPWLPNALNDIIKSNGSFECGNDTVKETFLNITGKMPFKCYDNAVTIEDAILNDTVKLCVVRLGKL